MSLATGHGCAGEWVAIDLSRMPTLANSRFVIWNTRRTAWIKAIFSIVGTRRAIVVSRHSQRRRRIPSGL